MSTPSAPEPFSPDDAERAARVAAIVEHATRVDGQPPFSDQSLVDLRTGRREGWVIESDGIVPGVAVMTVDGQPREAELVIAPASRRRGLGDRMLTHLLQRANGDLLIWAHGDHPDARALAARHGLQAVRELLQLRRRSTAAAPLEPTPPTNVAAFQPGADDTEWLALNALAFADHPEQGSLTQQDLDARIAEDWFDADDFLIARDDEGRMTGFCWLKVEHEIGEFYAVGVAPSAQGTGLGRRLVNAGLARLERRGIRESNLYVEADNAPAVALYRSVGFTDHSIDIQYSSRPA